MVPSKNYEFFSIHKQNYEWSATLNSHCSFGRPSALASCSTAEMSSSENIISEVKQSMPAMSERGSSSRKGKEPMGTEPSVNTNIRDDFTDSFKQWVAYGEALCHWSSFNFPFPTRTDVVCLHHTYGILSTFGYYGVILEEGLVWRFTVPHICNLTVVTKRSKEVYTEEQIIIKNRWDLRVCRVVKLSSLVVRNLW